MLFRLIGPSDDSQFSTNFRILSFCLMISRAVCSPILNSLERCWGVSPLSWR
uniref:Uncharacterized protein n=1 Tax=Anopheles christyi TaxID=43041 RepID=A0A182KIZ8_9DIPT